MGAWLHHLDADTAAAGEKTEFDTVVQAIADEDTGSQAEKPCCTERLPGDRASCRTETHTAREGAERSSGALQAVFRPSWATWHPESAGTKAGKKVAAQAGLPAAGSASG